MTLLIGIYFQPLLSNAQNGLNNSKKEVLNKILKDKNTYRNIKITDTSITCSMYINDELYSTDTRLFRNDTCYRFISVTSVVNHSIEKEVLDKLFGHPVIKNTWTYCKDNNYRIVLLEIYDDFSVTEMINYKDYDEYTNTIHFILNPTEYD